MSCQQVPTAPAFNPYPRSVQVGEFEVAIGGGIWVAIGAAKPLAGYRRVNTVSQLHDLANSLATWFQKQRD